MPQFTESSYRLKRKMCGVDTEKENNKKRRTTSRWFLIRPADDSSVQQSSHWGWNYCCSQIKAFRFRESLSVLLP